MHMHNFYITLTASFIILSSYVAIIINLFVLIYLHTCQVLRTFDASLEERWPPHIYQARSVVKKVYH